MSSLTLLTNWVDRGRKGYCILPVTWHFGAQIPIALLVALSFTLTTKILQLFKKKIPKHNEATNFQNYPWRSITDHRSNSTTTTGSSPWSSEPRFPHSKSNFPINQRFFSWIIHFSSCNWVFICVPFGSNLFQLRLII